MALILSLLFILLLRLVVGPLVLALILGVLGVLAYGMYHCWEEYQVLRDNGASITQLGFTTNLSVYRSVQETWLAAREYPAPLQMPAASYPGPDPAPLPLSTLSGRAGCARRSPAGHAHLPAAADPHRHRPPEGSQQVSACQRGGRGQGCGRVGVLGRWQRALEEKGRTVLWLTLLCDSLSEPQFTYLYSGG